MYGYYINYEFKNKNIIKTAGHAIKRKAINTSVNTTTRHGDAASPAGPVSPARNLFHLFTVRPVAPRYGEYSSNRS